MTKSGVESFERIPITIGSPPDQRPSVANPANQLRLKEHFEELDRQLQDSSFVNATWRRHVISELKHWIGRARRIDPEAAMYEILPFILYVAEGRNVANELTTMTAEYWDEFQKLEHMYPKPYNQHKKAWRDWLKGMR